MKQYARSGACPRCGAPIYGMIEGNDGEAWASLAPSAHFTCECRLTLPKPLPADEDLPAESLDEADRRHLARNRPGAEPESEERIHD